MKTILLVYFILIYFVLPPILFGWAISLYKKYTFFNLLNIFFASFLIFIPLVHFLLIGFSSMEGAEVPLNQFLFLFFPAIIFSIFGGLIGLLLNSVYILILRILKKA